MFIILKIYYYTYFCMSLKKCSILLSWILSYIYIYIYFHHIFYDKSKILISLMFVVLYFLEVHFLFVAFYFRIYSIFFMNFSFKSRWRNDKCEQERTSRINFKYFDLHYRTMLSNAVCLYVLSQLNTLSKRATSWQ